MTKVFKRPKKLQPLTQEESDRLVAEYLARGGKVTVIDNGSSLSGALKTNRKTGVKAQMPWVDDTLMKQRNEDADFME